MNMISDVETAQRDLITATQAWLDLDEQREFAAAGLKHAEVIEMQTRFALAVPQTTADTLAKLQDVLDRVSLEGSDYTPEEEGVRFCVEAAIAALKVGRPDFTTWVRRAAALAIQVGVSTDCQHLHAILEGARRLPD